jgi:hypothetical protein
LLVSQPASADPTADKAAAESLFQQGKAALDEGRYDEACAKLTESLRIERALGTLINLARCHELQGRTATSWAEYLEVSELAGKAGQSDRAKGAAELAGKLEPKLSKLRIDAPFPVSGLEIRRDDTLVGPGALGASVAVDPGEHVVTARASGYETWTTKIVVRPDADKVTVTIPRMQPSASVTPAVSPAPLPGDGKRAGGSGMRTAGFVISGLGLVGLGVGAVFGVMTFGDASDAENDPQLCPKKVCSAEGRNKIDAAETKGMISTVAFGAGAAAAGVGVVLVVLGSRSAGPSGPAKTGRAELWPWVGREGIGLGATGRF